MAYKARTCLVCTREFVPPHRATYLSTNDNHLTHCPGCRRLVKAALDYEPSPSTTPTQHPNAAPMRQIVFDLETWGLDRGWGVTMVGSMWIHGDGEVTRKTFTLRDYAPWVQGQRSNDQALVTDILKELARCHIAYAHNGERFDIRWLRSAALKYGLQMPQIKLVDPCQIAWQKYRIGRNSLEAVADFLGLAEQGYEKLHISPEVWRRALLDNDNEAWTLLVDRCETDVALLNAVAGRVTGDVGMVDFKGSWR